MAKYLHPDRPLETDTILWLLDQLLINQVSGRWRIAELTKWLDNELDAIADQIKYLQAKQIDVSTIKPIVDKLFTYYEGGRWDLISLGDWLDNDVWILMDELKRMEARFDEQFPDVETANVEQIIERKESA